MCRMALVLGKEKALKGFELSFKTAWGRGNDDGVGVYWRDYPVTDTYAFRHLARFPKTADLVRIGSTYDRLFIHFRNATGGDGTHPFSCIHKPENNSGDWFLAHNGCVQDEKARERLATTHKFSTEIDSEVMAHIWGDIDHTKPMPEQVEDFVAQINKDKVTGWANLIFYNVVTDEWVVFCDGNIKMSAVKDILVISSDTEWLDDAEAKKADVKVVQAETGSVIYGKGSDITERMKGAWSKKSATQSSYSGGEITVIDHWSDRYNMELPEAIEKCGDHRYVPDTIMDGDDGAKVCGVCWMDKMYHEAAGTLDDANNTAVDPKWRRKHTFERNDKVKGIFCKCGDKSCYGPYHLSHTFEPVKNMSNYCKVCGMERNVGNHKETSAKNHWFIAMKIMSTIMGSDTIKWVDSSMCQRCSKLESEHTMNKNLPKTPTKNRTVGGVAYSEGLITQYDKPNTRKGCNCNIAAKPVSLICADHWRDGFRHVEGQLISKVIRRKDGAILNEKDIWTVNNLPLAVQEPDEEDDDESYGD